jgi:chloride channel, nucleotide-sensitive, 1A
MTEISKDISRQRKSLLETTLSDSDQTLDQYFRMEVLQEAPKSDTFVPLSEHQSATPASFYLGPPVLHYHSGHCKVVILKRDLSQSPALTALARQAQGTPTSAEPVTNGNGDHTEEGEAETQKTLHDVDVWITSEYAMPLA